MSDMALDLTAVQPAEITSATDSAQVLAAGSGRLGRNILMLAGSQLASWLFAVCWSVIVPRRLGPGAIGEFVIAMSTAAVLAILIQQGASPLLTREIACDTSKAPQLVAGAIVMRLALAVPVCLGLFIYLRLVGFGSELVLLIWLATALVVTMSLSGAFEAAFAGVERMEYLAYATVIGNGLASVLGIVMVLAGGRVVSILMLNLLLAVLGLALNIYWARGLFAVAWRGASRVAPHILRAGFSFWIGGLFFTAYLWIDSIILSLLVPAYVVGWYGVPTQLFTAILMVASVLCTAMFPRLAAAHKHGTEALRQTARPAVEAAVVLSLPIAIGTALVAAPVVSFLYGFWFAGAAPVLAILGVSIVPTYFNMIAYQILYAEGRQVAWFKVTAIATVINIAANLVLIPQFQAHGNGAVGAALSLLGTEIFEAVVAICLLPWLLGRALFGRLCRVAAATAIMAVALVAVSPRGPIEQIAAGAMVFVVFALILRVPTSNELQLIRGLGARILSRLRLRAITALSR